MPQFPDWNNPHWYDNHHNACFKGHDKETEFYECAWEALPGLNHDNQLLEIGAGTGKFTEGILQLYPDLANITLIEPNKNRLELARKKLTALRPTNRITFLPKKLETLDQPRKFDIIVCMHTMREALATLALTNRTDSMNWLRQNIEHIYGILTSNGTFLWGDEIGYVEEHNVRENHTSLLEAWEIIELLQHTGFRKTECIYRYRNLAIHRATK